jgi:hypothetical protein
MIMIFYYHSVSAAGSLINGKEEEEDGLREFAQIEFCVHTLDIRTEWGFRLLLVG